MYREVYRNRDYRPKYYNSEKHFAPKYTYARQYQEKDSSAETIDNRKFILIPRKMLEKIAYTYYLTKHSQDRIRERIGDKDIKTLLLKSPLSWRNQDGTIIIAISIYAYFVVVEKDGEFYIKTFCEKSENNMTVVDKFVLAYMGYKRQANFDTWAISEDKEETKTEEAPVKSAEEFDICDEGE